MFLHRSLDRLSSGESFRASSVSFVRSTSIRRKTVERTVLERALVVLGLLQIDATELAAIDDQDSVLLELTDVHLERCRIHRHEDVGSIPRRVDVEIREANLERRHPGNGPGRRANLGREVRERRDVVPHQCGGVRELAPGQLHPVPGVAGETDHDLVQLLRRSLLVFGSRHAIGAVRRWTSRTTAWPRPSRAARDYTSRRGAIEQLWSATHGLPAAPHAPPRDETARWDAPNRNPVAPIRIPVDRARSRPVAAYNAQP